MLVGTDRCGKWPRPRVTARCTLERVLTQTQPPGTLAARPDQRAVRGVTMLRSQTYELTFTGQAGTTLRGEFDDCEISIHPGTTTLRAELPDQGALTELIQRITGLGLEVVDLHLITPPGR